MNDQIILTLKKRLEEEMQSEGIEAWICPSCLDRAPKGLESTGSPIMNLPWTQAGLPALTLPSGKDDAGLPHGVQLVGYFGEDEALVASARAIYAILKGA